MAKRILLFRFFYSVNSFLQGPAAGNRRPAGGGGESQSFLVSFRAPPRGAWGQKGKKPALDCFQKPAGPLGGHPGGCSSPRNTCLNSCSEGLVLPSKIICRGSDVLPAYSVGGFCHNRQKTSELVTDFGIGSKTENRGKRYFPGRNPLFFDV